MSSGSQVIDREQVRICRSRFVAAAPVLSIPPPGVQVLFNEAVLRSRAFSGEFVRVAIASDRSATGGEHASLQRGVAARAPACSRGTVTTPELAERSPVTACTFDPTRARPVQPASPALDLSPSPPVLVSDDINTSASVAAQPALYGPVTAQEYQRLY